MYNGCGSNGSSDCGITVFNHDSLSQNLLIWQSDENQLFWFTTALAFLYFFSKNFIQLPFYRSSCIFIYFFNELAIPRQVSLCITVQSYIFNVNIQSFKSVVLHLVILYSDFFVYYIFQSNSFSKNLFVFRQINQFKYFDDKTLNSSR